jgi:hypothetical protein
VLGAAENRTPAEFWEDGREHSKPIVTRIVPIEMQPCEHIGDRALG